MTFSPSMSVGALDYGNPFDVVLDNTGPSNQVLYEAAAYPGTADTVGVAQWRIKKFFFDGNNQVTGWRWANASIAFDKDWTLRSTYTYAAL